MSAARYRWTLDTEEMFRALWAEGRSAREIALAIDQSGALTVKSIVAKRQHLALAPRKLARLPWPDEDAERLESMWAEGGSVSQIARALGVTRNAVIGKVHRLGLTRPERPRATAPRSARPRAIPPPTPPYPPTLPLVESLRVRLVDLGVSHCRYPLWPHDGMGWPEFHHCGLPRTLGSSYCPAHARLCGGAGARSEWRAA